MKRLKALMLFLSLTMPISVLAQHEHNYIYVLDCTKPMTGFGAIPELNIGTVNLSSMISSSLIILYC